MRKTLFLLAIFVSFTIAFESDVMCAGLNTKILVKSELSWDGKNLPEYPKGKPEISILKITIPPKSKLPMHVHPYINAGVLLKGKLKVITTDNKVLILNAGEALVEVVDTIHYGVNEGDEPAEIIVFYAGIKDKAVTELRP